MIDYIEELINCPFKSKRYIHTSMGEVNFNITLYDDDDIYIIHIFNVKLRMDE